MQTQPITVRYDGEGMFSPFVEYWARKADEHYVVGEVYVLVEHRDRSQISHDHQFAFIGEAWKNLPEKHRHEPWAQSPEHLRKFGLIRSGFCHTQTYPCASRAEAERTAAALRPFDEFSLVSVQGNLVHRFTAESQRMRGVGAMDAERFQASKQALMDWLDDMLGVDRGATAQNAREAA